MKKLMALIALVAMVAVSSVAFAQTGAITVSGSIDSGTLALGDCSIGLGIIPTSATVASASCTTPGSITANSPSGVAITIQGGATYSNTLEQTTSGDVITTLDDSAAGDDQCAAGTECYAFGGVTLVNTGAATTYSAGNTGEGTVDTAGDHHGIPANGAAANIVDATDAGLFTAATYDLTLFASASSTTDAGAYAGDLILTISEL